MTGLLSEYCWALGPVAFCIPTVAPPPLPTADMMSLYVKSKLGLFSYRHTPKLNTGEPVINATRHSMQKTRFGELPLSETNMPQPVQSVRRSSQ
jgi:hypothetical protein